MKIAFIFSPLPLFKFGRKAADPIQSAAYFVKADFDMLSSLGHHLVVPESLFELILCRPSHVFCWWWGRSLFAIIVSRLLGITVTCTGVIDYCLKHLPPSYPLRKALDLSYKPLWIKLSYQLAILLCNNNLFISEFEMNSARLLLPRSNHSLLPLSLDDDLIALAKSLFFSSLNDDISSFKSVLRPEVYSLLVSHQPFFFSVSWLTLANLDRKGVLLSMKAFSSIMHPSASFVVGGNSNKATAEILEYAKTIGMDSKFYIFEYLSQIEKILLFKYSLAYLQPSFHEGFGHALLEAQIFSPFVVVSTFGSLPEVANPYTSIKVNPFDIESLRLVLESLLSKGDCQNKRLLVSSLNWSANKFSSSKRRNALELFLS